MEGKVALVTGATRGIGLGIARDLAEAGATVLMNHRGDPQRAAAALEEVRSVRPDARLLRADVTDAAAVEAMFREVRATHGRLDALVVNAGVSADGHALMMGENTWRTVLDTNLTGAFLCTRAASRLMVRARSGAIVAIGSTSGTTAPAGQANYAAAKAGLLAMVRVLAKEVGQHGVRVNAVVPGFVDTAMTRAMPPARLEEYLRMVPLGRIGDVGDVTPAVRFLLSDHARYMTGTSVVIDGGLTS